MKNHMHILHRCLSMIFELEVMSSHDEPMLQLKDVRVAHVTALPLPAYLVDQQPSWQLPLSWLMIHQVCPRKGKSHFAFVAPPSATPTVFQVWSKQWLQSSVGTKVVSEVLKASDLTSSSEYQKLIYCDRKYFCFFKYKFKVITPMEFLETN